MVGSTDKERWAWQTLRTLVATDRLYPNQMGEQERLLMFEVGLMDVQPAKEFGAWRWKRTTGATLLFKKIRLDLAIEHDLLVEKLTTWEAVA